MTAAPTLNDSQGAYLPTIVELEDWEREAEPEHK
jgi:hypothetical protein